MATFVVISLIALPFTRRQSVLGLRLFKPEIYLIRKGVGWEWVTWEKMLEEGEPDEFW